MKMYGIVQKKGNETSVTTGACAEDFPGADWRDKTPLQIAKIISNVEEDGIDEDVVEVGLEVSEWRKQVYGQGKVRDVLHRVIIATWTPEEFRSWKGGEE